MSKYIHVRMCESVDADEQIRQLRDEDCCPRREEHRVIYPTQSGMIPNYTGHLPGNYYRVFQKNGYPVLFLG